MLSLKYFQLIDQNSSSEKKNKLNFARTGAIDCKAYNK